MLKRLSLAGPAFGPWEVAAFAIACARLLFAMYIDYMPKYFDIIRMDSDLVFLPLTFFLARRYYMRARIHIPFKRIMAIWIMLVASVLGWPFALPFFIPALSPLLL